MENYYDDDDDLEMAKDLNVEDGLPLIVELSQGRNESAFHCLLQPGQPRQRSRSNLREDIQLVPETVPTYTVQLSLLDAPAHECNNGIDDDSDGYADDTDPDCADFGETEDGYGDTKCNDGRDNDDDGSSTRMIRTATMQKTTQRRTLRQLK